MCNLAGVKRVTIEALKKRDGQVLPVMLALMAIGGLIIGPSLDFLSTGLRSGRLLEEQIRNLYAADSGIEHGLWKLKNAPPDSYPYTYTLPPVNGTPVTVTLSMSNVLWGFSLGESGPHEASLLLHATMIWDSSQGNYGFTITLTNTNDSNVHLNYIMVTPPTGYSYISGSASGTTTEEPEVAGDPNGNTGMRWDFSTPRPNIPPAPDPSRGEYSSVYQYFRLAGPEGYSGSAGYIWVSAEREDIGTVSTATAMKVTAKAMRDGSPVATASSLALVDNETGSVLIGSWQISR